MNSKTGEVKERVNVKKKLLNEFEGELRTNLLYYFKHKSNSSTLSHHTRVLIYDFFIAFRLTNTTEMNT